MEKDRRIKDIYECNYIEELYPLQKWYNQLIGKRISEIDVSDVLRMIRQKEFVDIAVLKAVEFLKENPFVGDMHEGELLEKLSDIDIGDLKDYLDEIRNVLSNASIKNRTYDWLCEEEREEFEEVINSFLEKI